jgi:hypothetical protein
MSSKTPGQGLDLTPLRVKLAHADENPVVRLAANGDQNPITVPHDEWRYLWELRHEPSAQACISREYPGLWIRALINELGKGK